jgi:alanyl-tRNA synthetase
VAWDRLRFDFTHHGPLTKEQVRAVEDRVTRGILLATPVVTTEKPYQEAIASGAMALFGEKYGDVVRVVGIEGLSTELCGGTHVRNTAEIGLFKIVAESGIAAGVRRIEAITGSKAQEWVREQTDTLHAVADVAKATPATVLKRVQALADERKALEKRLADMMRDGVGSPVQALIDGAQTLNGLRVIAQPVDVPDVKALQALADAIREKAADVVAVLVASFGETKNTVVVAAGDVARSRGVRADAVVKALAESVGGRGGGKPQLAQAGFPDAATAPTLLGRVAEVVATLSSAPAA